MGLNLKRKSKNTFLKILANGKFAHQVEPGTVGATRRDFTVKDKTTGEEVAYTKFEVIYSDMDGFITNIAFEKTKFGPGMTITLNDHFVVQTLVTSEFASDIMKKMPNIDFAKEVILDPYNFFDEKAKKDRKGMTIYQGDNLDPKLNKVADYFFDPATKERLHEIPVANIDNVEEVGFWKNHFNNVANFLVKWTKEDTLPRLESTDQTGLFEEETAPVYVVKEVAETIPMGTETSTEDLVAKTEEAKAPAEVAEAPVEEISQDNLEAKLEDVEAKKSLL